MLSGGAVICTPGYYLGKIIDAKDVLGKRFVVSELSRINVDHEMKRLHTHMNCLLKARNVKRAGSLWIHLHGK